MKVVVVGGGFAGLVAATRLADDGHAVTLVEARGRLGGRLAGAHLDDAEAHDGARGLRPGPLLLLGCYRGVRSFFTRIGAPARVAFDATWRLPVVDRETRRAHVLEPALSATPFGRLHGLAAVARFSGLSLGERGLALRLAAALAAPSRLASSARATESADAWLARLSQPEGARRALWRPLALAALADDPHRAAAPLLEATLREQFLGAPDDAALHAPDEDSAALWVEPSRRFLAERGATVRTGARVERIHARAVRDRTILDGVSLSTGERLEADAVVAAVAPPRLLALVDEAVRAEPWFDSLARLAPTGEIDVHLRTARPPLEGVLAQPAGAALAAIAGSPFHWLLARPSSSRAGNGAASAAATGETDVWLRAIARPELEATSDAELCALAAAELERLAPSAGPVRAVGVTRRPWAGVALAGRPVDRPKPRTPVEGLFVAGSYVRTGLPGNLESAARAADDAATMALEFEPPPPPPAPQGFVPASRLVRRTPSVAG